MDAVAPERLLALQKGQRLEVITVGWNLAEAVVALVSGFLAGSIALLGFGFDSAIELAAGGLLFWWLGSSGARAGASEKQVLRLVAVTFFLLAAYISGDAIFALVKHRVPEASIPGMVITAAAIVVMPLLARAKRKLAAQLGSNALHSESRQTQICAYLSAITLGGLALNSLLGWWWADPAAALAMAPLIANEGREAWSGRSCCDDVEC